MKKELEDIICAAAPKLMCNMRGDMTKTCLAFGFECGDGWFSLILEAATELEALGTSMICTQVKEKFGTLSFYVGHVPHGADQILRRAELRSSQECEDCGARGQRGGYNYIRTLCAKHTITEDED